MFTGDRFIGVVNLTSTLIKHNVLQHCQPHSEDEDTVSSAPDDQRDLGKHVRTSSKLDGVPDVRLLLLSEVYTLGIAPTFDVGDAVVTPTVLIIADQQPVVVC
jgi:hypothetical protein